MRRSFLFVLALMTSCGGRTGIGSSGVGSPDEGGVPPSNAFRVLYAIDGMGSLTTWHSDGASTIDKTARIGALSCTYDGRYVALSDWAIPGQMQVRDATGTVVRVQKGAVEALRPDGARAIVGDLVDDKTYCNGTLDADGTYSSLGCFPQLGDGLFANAYAPDAKSVLWTRTVYDPVTTVTYGALEIGHEDGSDRHEIAPLSALGHYYASASFSFDGTAVVYVDCMKNYDEMFCDLDSVDTETLATTTLLQHEPWILGAAFTPDGSSVVFMQSATPALQSHVAELRSLDLATRATSTLFEESHGTLLPGAFCVTSE